MSEWVDGHLSDSIAALDAGVSVNAEDRPYGAGELGVLKTSAVSGGKFFREQNKTVLQHERRLVAEPVQGDSILVSRMNTPALVGEACYVRNPEPSLFLPDRLWQLKPKDRSIIHMRWLSFVLQSTAYRRYVEVHATGTSGSMKNLPKSKLLGLPVRYPVPREQAKIAEILDTLDTAIHETEAIVAKLKAVKQGLLHDLLTRGIDTNGELRPPQGEAPHLYKKSPLGWIPKEWDVRRLDSCADISSGLTLGRSVSGIGLLELPYLRVANVQDGYVDLTEVKTAKILSSELERFALADGDVLMNEGGDYDKLGRGTVWRAQITPCLHQNHVFRVRCNWNVLIPDYLAAYSTSQRGKTFFLQSSKQSTNLASINSTQLRAFSIACPNLAEQLKIIERLRAADDRLSQEESNLKKQQVFKSGLMDDLLTGRVRVTPLLEGATP